MVVSPLEKFKGLPIPEQSIGEWQAYLEFIEAYFRNRKIDKPMIVEIGVGTNAQKRFYEELLGYNHIGIDIKPKRNPDIVGDSGKSATLDKLEGRLKGREINLVYIDAYHSYSAVKRDYELYSPLARNIIVLHDVMLKEYENTVGKFWNELVAENREAQDRTFITFAGYHRERFGQGTGLILLETMEEES